MELHFTLLQSETPSTLFPIAFLIGAIVVLIPLIFYLITLQKTLKAIAPQNRRMEPGMVWLMFIPLFNIVWQFIMISRIADSIKAELIMRNKDVTGRPTYNVGLTFCILGCVTWIPILGTFLALAALVCLIVHWVKVNEYKNKFLSEPYQPDNESQIFNYTQ